MPLRILSSKYNNLKLKSWNGKRHLESTLKQVFHYKGACTIATGPVGSPYRVELNNYLFYLVFDQFEPSVSGRYIWAKIYLVQFGQRKLQLDTLSCQELDVNNAA